VNDVPVILLQVENRDHISLLSPHKLLLWLPVKVWILNATSQHPTKYAIAYLLSNVYPENLSPRKLYIERAVAYDTIFELDRSYVLHRSFLRICHIPCGDHEESSLTVKFRERTKQ